jgi:hypothetical protein
VWCATLVLAGLAKLLVGQHREFVASGGLLGGLLAAESTAEVEFCTSSMARTMAPIADPLRQPGDVGAAMLSAHCGLPIAGPPYLTCEQPKSDPGFWCTSTGGAACRGPNAGMKPRPRPHLYTREPGMHFAGRRIPAPPQKQLFS